MLTRAYSKEGLGKVLLFFAGLTLSLLFATFFTVPATHAQSPADCTEVAPRPYIGYNRKAWCGYFNNEGWTAGAPLRGGSWNPDGTWTDATAADPGVPDSLEEANGPDGFVMMILNDYYNGDQRARTAAEFIILSMLGVLPDEEGTVDKEVTPEQIIEWQNRVLSYANIDDNSDGSGVSTGDSGTITWKDERHLDCGEVNTYYQIEFDDVAPFEVNTANTPDCDDPTFVEEYIVFTDNDGNELMTIRRICMNPAGEISPLPEADSVVENGVLGNLVFEDVNNDGVYDPASDAGIPNVTVALYAADDACNLGDPIGTAITDENGTYQFNNLFTVSPMGKFANYVVAVTDENNVLAGYTVTTGQSGIDGNSQDSSGYCMQLTWSEDNNQTGDFGYYRDMTNAEAGSETGELAATGSNIQLLFIVVGGLFLSATALFSLRFATLKNQL